MTKDGGKVLVLFSPLIQEHNHTVAVNSDFLPITLYDVLSKKALDDRGRELL